MPVELFDTHCHLTFAGLGERCDQVVADARAAGVSRMMTVACTPSDFEPSLALHRRHERLWVAAGIHPHEAAKVTDADFQRLQQLWHDEAGVVAAGEMGLDYHYDFSPAEVQQTVFRRQLDLAAASGLPIVVHCREAHDDVVRILLDAGYADRPVVFHCFTGSPAEAAQIREHGWWTSFTGVVTFRKSDAVRQACIETPLDRLMFETDAPYLSPEPIRHLRPNEPRHLEHTIRFAAGLLGTTFEALAAATTANALRFFRLAGK